MTTKKSSSNKLAAILISFIFLNVLFDDLGIRWSFSMIFLFALVFIDCAKKGKLYIRRSIVSRSIILFACSVLLLYLLFDSRKDLETISYMITLVICMLFVCFAQADYAQMTFLIRMLTIAGTIVALYVCLMRFLPGVYQVILRFLPQSVREYNEYLMKQGYGVPVGGSIVYADYMISMVIIAFLSAILTKQERMIFHANYKIKFWIIAILMLFAMLFEQRRGEPVCLVLTLLLMGFTGFNRQSISTRARRIFLLVIAGFALLILFIFLRRFGSASRFIASTMEGILAGDISNGRLIRWNHAITIFRQHPIIGFGWGRFGNYYWGKSDVVNLLNIYKYVHNDYLNVLCETGIIGFVLIYTPLLVVLLATIKQTKELISLNRRGLLEDPLKLTFSYFCLGGQYYWTILALVEPVLYKQMFLFYYAFLMICLKTVLGSTTQEQAMESVKIVK